MSIESITFNTAQSKLTVTYDDGSAKDYYSRASYIADFPHRFADCDSMGWVW